MVAYQACVLGHGRAIFRVGSRAHRGEKRVQGHLGIDDDLRFARQMHDQVRAQAALFGVHGLLLQKIAMWRHPGQFNRAPQRQFAPLSL